MARSDLLVSLVKAGTVGDRRGFRSAAEAISAEQRAKRHNVLANRLTHVIQSNGSGPYGPVMTAPDAIPPLARSRIPGSRRVPSQDAGTLCARGAICVTRGYM